MAIENQFLVVTHDSMRGCVGLLVRRSVGPSDTRNFGGTKTGKNEQKSDQ